MREPNDRERREEPRIRIEDRRHWAVAASTGEGAPDGERASAASDEPIEPEIDIEASDQDDTRPGPTGEELEAVERRAAAAEDKLREVVAAFQSAREEQDRIRERLTADVDRRVDLRFGEIAEDVLDCVDDLELAVAHVEGVEGAEPLARGVRLVRDRLLASLKKHGVEPIDVDGQAFDPNNAEAMRVEPVDDRELDGIVTETLRTGYRLGDRVLRPARVAVGKA